MDWVWEHDEAYERCSRLKRYPNVKQHPTDTSPNGSSNRSRLSTSCWLSFITPPGRPRDHGTFVHDLRRRIFSSVNPISPSWLDLIKELLASQGETAWRNSVTTKPCPFHMRQAQPSFSYIALSVDTSPPSLLNSYHSKSIFYPSYILAFWPSFAGTL
jgi:hypothetical protein